MVLTLREWVFLVGLWLAMALLTALLARRLGLSRSLWTAIGLLLGVFAPFVILIWSGREAEDRGGGRRGRDEPRREEPRREEPRRDDGLRRGERDERIEPGWRREPSFDDETDERREPRMEVMEPRRGAPERRSRPVAEGALGDNLKQCPRCAELIRIEAAVCRFCGNEFERSAEIRQFRQDPRRHR